MTIMRTYDEDSLELFNTGLFPVSMCEYGKGFWDRFRSICMRGSSVMIIPRKAFFDMDMLDRLLVMIIRRFCMALVGAADGHGGVYLTKEHSLIERHTLSESYS